MHEADSRSTSAAHMQTIATAILNCNGDLDPALRQAIFERAVSHAQATSPARPSLPLALGELVDLVATQAFKIDDAIIAQARAADFSEDAILEAILSAAVGAGASRLAIGLAALHGEG